MEELVKRLQDIREQVLTLKTENDRLLRNQDGKDKEIQRLKQLVEIQNSSIKELELKSKIRRIAEEATSDGSPDANKSRELKFKINEMIREVDKIMTLMHQ